MLTLRISPPIPVVRPMRLVERNLLVYRRAFAVVLSGIVEPLFYIFAMGLGVGALIGNIPLGNGQEVPYVAFVGSGILATTAMNGAIFEGTNAFFYKLKYGKTYEAMVATPMSIGDIVRGEIVWAMLRGSLHATGFMALTAGMMLIGVNLLSSPIGILAFPMAMIIGFGFAGATMAGTTFIRKWQDFDFLQLMIMPMFLFSGTFYPIAAYPPALQTFIQFTPLYRGVHMLRALMIGPLDGVVAIDVVYLLAMGFIGIWITTHRLQKRLSV
jgi:lipooligosaccharide transport system permease protein